MPSDKIQVTDANNATIEVVTDTITSLNGNALSPAQDVQRNKVGYGSDNTFRDVDTSFPLPVREPTRGSAAGKGGVTSSSSNQALVTTNSNRTIVEVANGGASGIWVAFGATATVGTGSYVPAKSTGYWYTTAAVNIILETGGSAGPVGYTEW